MYLHDRFCFLLLLLIIYRANGVIFDDNYEVLYGNDHFTSYQGRVVQLSMDQASGSGFDSKLSYGSGAFHMRIKVPARDCAGVVTAFYLTSIGNHHDELDFEFLGNREGKPLRLQTNVFANGVGNREQRMFLWFDPSADFHNYSIIWNPHQIVFYVDNTPIRVFKNINGNYPMQAMKLTATLWNGDSWATDGGKAKVDWSHGPFRAYFQDFGIDGCPCDSSNIQMCNSSKYWWNGERYWDLSPTEKKRYHDVKNKYTYYDYCTDKPRFPVPPPECNFD